MYISTIVLLCISTKVINMTIKKYAVSAMNFYDNYITTNLTTKIVEADTWKQALLQHPEFAEDEDRLSWMSDDIESAKEEAFNYDLLFDVVVIQ